MAEKLSYLGTNNQFVVDGNDDTTGGVIRLGTAASPLDLGATADRTGIQGHFTSSAATGGDVWGLYVQQDLTGGGGGYGGIFKCSCTDDTPADTPHGLYANLYFGSSAGNITGLGCAFRTNVFVPNRNLGGTVTALMTEFYAEGTASDMSAGSLIRFTIIGNATG